MSFLESHNRNEAAERERGQRGKSPWATNLKRTPNVMKDIFADRNNSLISY